MLRFSLVVCSVDRARLDECIGRYRTAFAEEPFELIVIDDARSLAEGYNRGIACAHGANIVFSHDDAFPISAAFADRLARISKRSTSSASPVRPLRFPVSGGMPASLIRTAMSSRPRPTGRMSICWCGARPVAASIASGCSTDA